MTETATVFLVDDHPVVRLGYRMLLGRVDHIRILDEVENGTDAIRKIPSSLPNLAIVDLSLPDISGLKVTRHLQRECPDVKVLIVSAHRTRSSVRRALEAGARGYIVKDKAEALVLHAMEEILRGRMFICDEMKEKLGDDLENLRIAQ